MVNIIWDDGIFNDFCAQIDKFWPSDLRIYHFYLNFESLTPKNLIKVWHNKLSSKIENYITQFRKWSPHIHNLHFFYELSLFNCVIFVIFIIFYIHTHSEFHFLCSLTSQRIINYPLNISGNVCSWNVNGSGRRE